MAENGSPRHYAGDEYSAVTEENGNGEDGCGGGGPMSPLQQPFEANEMAIDGNYAPSNYHSSYHRRFRASRNFKNPPQPHMCIREKTADGKELFINVLSWTRIANPNDKNAPIPLFGGMRVPPGSPRSPPLVYAVMASPEVLKQAGRKCPDTPERMNLVDLMCEFVEEMNPGLQLSRKPEILKDRDISGELKDVWSAVQAVREKQRAESQYATQENLVLYTEFGPPDNGGLGGAAPPYDQIVEQRETVIHHSSSAISNEREETLSENLDAINAETENMTINAPVSTTEEEEEKPPEVTSIAIPQDNKDAHPSSPEVVQPPSPAKVETSSPVVQPQPQPPATPAPPPPSVTTTTNKKESTSTGHHFFPKFRKNSSNHASHQTHADEADGGGKKNDEESHHTPPAQPPHKNKKGIGFFRRRYFPKGEKQDTATHDKTDSEKEIIENATVVAK